MLCCSSVFSCCTSTSRFISQPTVVALAESSSLKLGINIHNMNYHELRLITGRPGLYSLHSIHCLSLNSTDIYIRSKCNAERSHAGFTARHYYYYKYYDYKSYTVYHAISMAIGNDTDRYHFTIFLPHLCVPLWSGVALRATEERDT